MLSFGETFHPLEYYNLIYANKIPIQRDEEQIFGNMGMEGVPRDLKLRKYFTM
jgi:hypothetical protein